MTKREFLTQEFYKELDSIATAQGTLTRIDPIEDLKVLARAIIPMMALIEVMDDSNLFFEKDDILSDELDNFHDQKLEEYKSQIMSYTD